MVYNINFMNIAKTLTLCMLALQDSFFWIHKSWLPTNPATLLTSEATIRSAITAVSPLSCTLQFTLYTSHALSKTHIEFHNHFSIFHHNGNPQEVDMHSGRLVLHSCATILARNFRYGRVLTQFYV